MIKEVRIVKREVLELLHCPKAGQRVGLKRTEKIVVTGLRSYGRGMV